MTGGFLPPAILCAALAIAAASLPLRDGLLAGALAAIVALAVSVIPIPASWNEAVFIGCWLSVVASAASLFPVRVPLAVSIALAVNTGLWAGGVCSVSGRQEDFFIALPMLLLVIPAQMFVARGWSIALKVLASWLTAVAILATMVSLTPTPGYVPDHME
jgi:hypothetical protein